MIRYTKSIKYSKNLLGCYVKPELIKDLSYKIMKNKFLGSSAKRLMKKKNKTDQVFLMKSKAGAKE